MTFSFHPEAEAGFNEAIEYYEGCEQGLGYDFSIEVFEAIQEIVNYPTAWPIIENDVRRCLVNRKHGLMREGWQNSMVRLLRHCRTKGAETDRPCLNCGVSSLLYPNTPFLIGKNLHFKNLLTFNKRKS